MADVVIDQLTKAINDALKEYADGVGASTKEAVAKVAKQATSSLRKESAKNFGSGPYSKSWKNKVETIGHSSTATIYSTMPGLPHLLEKGHANRNGTRTEGRPHIAPVADALGENFEKELTDLIEGKK